MKRFLSKAGSIAGAMILCALASGYAQAQEQWVRTNVREGWVGRNQADDYTLAAQGGQSYMLVGVGISMDDVVIRVYDAAGNLLAVYDDAFGTHDAVGTFVAPYAGTFIIEVGAYNRNTDWGSYRFETWELLN